MDPRHASFLQGVEDATRNRARASALSFDVPKSTYFYEAAGWREAGIHANYPPSVRSSNLSPNLFPYEGQGWEHVGVGASSKNYGFGNGLGSGTPASLCGFSTWPRGGAYTEYDATVDTPGSEIARAINHEFIPQSSLLASTAGASGDPGGIRLMLAVSPDGETWTKTGMVIANHSSVPCLAVEKNRDGEETLYLYFCTARNLADTYLFAGDETNRNDGARPTPLAVAYTTNLREWKYRLLGDRGFGFTYPNLSDPSYNFNYDMTLDDSYSANDPSVVRAEDGGGWLMYYTLHWGRLDKGQGGAMVLVATAEHLYNHSWVTDTSAVPILPTSIDFVTGANAEDPNAFRRDPSGGAPPGYLLFAGGDKPGYNWRAGLNHRGRSVYTSDEIKITCLRDGGPHQVIMNNAVVGQGTATELKWIASVGPDLGVKFIASVSVSDTGEILSGASPVGERGASCKPLLDPESNERLGIREAAVAQFRGCWVMVYASSIPGR